MSEERVHDPVAGLSPRQAAKVKAVEYARAQATDEEILAILRVDMCGDGSQITPARLLDGFTAWMGMASSKGSLLNDARTAGRVDMLRALRGIATSDKHTAAARTQAAKTLLDRTERIAGLSDKVDKQRRKMADLDERQVLEHVIEALGGPDECFHRFVEAFGGALTIKERLGL